MHLCHFWRALKSNTITRKGSCVVLLSSCLVLPVFFCEKVATVESEKRAKQNKQCKTKQDRESEGQARESRESGKERSFFNRVRIIYKKTKRASESAGQKGGGSVRVSFACVLQDGQKNMHGEQNTTCMPRTRHSHGSIFASFCIFRAKIPEIYVGSAPSASKLRELS